MGITTVTYDIHDLAEYINWIYFFHASGISATVCNYCRYSRL